MDRQLLRKKVRQRISVMKTNNGVFVVFKTKHELKCQFSGNTSPLLRFFDERFDIIFDNPFLTLKKYCANEVFMIHTTKVSERCIIQKSIP